MHMTVIGGIDDVVGFRLAGIPGAVCDSREAVERALERGRMSGTVLLVAISPSAAALAPQAVKAAVDRPGGPHVVVLPAGGGA